MINTAIVMLGGALGSAMRFQLGRLAMRLFGPGWPWGTFAANILGGLAMGLLAGWLALRGQGSGEQIRLFAAVGILGGFTTFSSFSLETMLMIERGQWVGAVTYALASVALSIIALGAGLMIVRATA